MTRTAILAAILALAACADQPAAPLYSDAWKQGMRSLLIRSGTVDAYTPPIEQLMREGADPDAITSAVALMLSSRLAGAETARLVEQHPEAAAAALAIQPTPGPVTCTAAPGLGGQVVTSCW